MFSQEGELRHSLFLSACSYRAVSRLSNVAWLRDGSMFVAFSVIISPDKIRLFAKCFLFVCKILSLFVSYMDAFSCCVVSTDYRLGDQSGCLEDPQPVIDCCYFVPPICDRKRKCAAFFQSRTTLYSNHSLHIQVATGGKNKTKTRMKTNSKAEECGMRRGKKSNFSSDISQWFNTPSVINQSQNAPSVITRILLVCLPVNQLGNQQKPHLIHNGWFDLSSHQKYFIRFSSCFRMTLHKALLITRLVTKCFMEWQWCEKRPKTNIKGQMIVAFEFSGF